MKILSKKKYNKLIEDFEELQKKDRRTQKDNREYQGKSWKIKRQVANWTMVRISALSENSYRYKTYWGVTEIENAVVCLCHLARVLKEKKRLTKNQRSRWFSWKITSAELTNTHTNARKTSVTAVIGAWADSIWYRKS